MNYRYGLVLYNAYHKEGSPSRTASMVSYNIKHHFQLLCDFFALLASTYLSKIWWRQ